MQYRNIPGTPLSPSVVCFGTSKLGSDVPEADAFLLLDKFYELGGTFLDTAKVYGDWLPGERSASEKTIGRWLASRGTRQRMIVATKGGHPELDAMHISRLRPDLIVADVESSLTHLQTDCIDLYWLHRDDPDRPVSELIDVLEEQTKRGTIRCYGCSNWRPERIEEANRYARATGKTGFVANQPKWSLAVPVPGKDPTMVQMDEAGLDYHRKTGLTAIPYNSQATGFFSGAYSPDDLRRSLPHTDRVKAYRTERNIGTLERVLDISERTNRSGSQISLAVLLAHPFPVFPIVGCKKPEHLTDSCAAADIRLDHSAISYITGE